MKCFISHMSLTFTLLIHSGTLFILIKILNRFKKNQKNHLDFKINKMSNSFFSLFSQEYKFHVLKTQTVKYQYLVIKHSFIYYSSKKHCKITLVNYKYVYTYVRFILFQRQERPPNDGRQSVRQ